MSTDDQSQNVVPEYHVTFEELDVSFSEEEIKDFYHCYKGLVQGQALSPLIFSIFTNDTETDLLHNKIQPLGIHKVNVFLVMFADDTVTS